VGYARDMNTVVIIHVMVSQVYNQTNIHACSPCGLQSTRYAAALLRLYLVTLYRNSWVCVLYTGSCSLALYYILTRSDDTDCLYRPQGPQDTTILQYKTNM